MDHDLDALGLTSDIGDIEKLSRYVPFDARQDFDGDIFELNWNAPVVNRLTDEPAPVRVSSTGANAAEEMRAAAIRALSSLNADLRVPETSS